MSNPLNRNKRQATNTPEVSFLREIQKVLERDVDLDDHKQVKAALTDLDLKIQWINLQLKLHNYKNFDTEAALEVLKSKAETLAKIPAKNYLKALQEINPKQLAGQIKKDIVFKELTNIDKAYNDAKNSRPSKENESSVKKLSSSKLQLIELKSQLLEFEAVHYELFNEE